jgi:RNA polymerase sigma factor (sigma-70 family)
MNSEPATRASLLLRLRDLGDAQAWSQFVRLYLPLVYEYLRRRGLQDADAADVAQNVLTSIAGAMPGFVYDPGRGSFRGWLLTVTRSRAVEWWQKERRQAALAGSAAGDWADQRAIEAERAAWEDDYRHALLACAAERVRPQIQENTWQAFWRTSLEEQPVEAVAAALGMSVGAVYVARSRVMARLREVVGELEMHES